MKKIIIIIAAILMLLTGVVGVSAVVDYVKTEISTICYYGCPNSRRVQKLNLAKSKKTL